MARAAGRRKGVRWIDRVKGLLGSDSGVRGKHPEDWDAIKWTERKRVDNSCLLKEARAEDFAGRVVSAEPLSKYIAATVKSLPGGQAKWDALTWTERKRLVQTTNKVALAEDFAKEEVTSEPLAKYTSATIGTLPGRQQQWDAMSWTQRRDLVETANKEALVGEDEIYRYVYSVRYHDSHKNDPEWLVRHFDFKRRQQVVKSVGADVWDVMLWSERWAALKNVRPVQQPWQGWAETSGGGGGVGGSVGGRISPTAFGHRAGSRTRQDRRRRDVDKHPSVRVGPNLTPVQVRASSTRRRPTTATSNSEARMNKPDLIYPGDWRRTRSSSAILELPGQVTGMANKLFTPRGGTLYCHVVAAGGISFCI